MTSASQPPRGGSSPRTGRSVLRRWSATVLGVVGAVVLFEFCLQAVALTLWFSHAAERTPAAAGRVVLCVGDSFTFGLGASDSSASYPAALQRLVDAWRPGEFTVVNGGWPGQTSADVLRKLPEQLATYRPECTLVLVGYNDQFKHPARLPETSEEHRANEPASFPVRLRTLDLLGRLGDSGFSRDNASVDDLVGGWRSGDFELALGADGLATLLGMTIPYRVSADRLVLGSDAASATVLDWQLADGDLIVRGAGIPGGELRLQRSADVVGKADLSPWRRILEKELQAPAPAPERVLEVCASLRNEMDQPDQWWWLAAAAARGVARGEVFATIEHALGSDHLSRQLEPALLRMRAALLQDAQPDAALADLVRAALCDGQLFSVTDWLDARHLSALQIDAALAQLAPEDRARVPTGLFAPKTVEGAQQTAEILAEHMRRIADQCQQAGGRAVFLDYPESVQDWSLAARRAGLGTEGGLEFVDVGSPLQDAMHARGRDAILVMDGHCTDAGYQLMAEAVFARLRAELR